MGKTVRRKHNKDGSVTTTTTYSRKNIFGTRVVDTYTSRSQPKNKQRRSAESDPSMPPVDSGISLSVILFAIGIFTAIPIISEGAWGGLIISAIFIAIGVLRLPVIREHFQKSNQIIPQNQNSWICPDCDMENSNSSMVCKGCGRYR